MPDIKLSNINLTYEVIIDKRRNSIQLTMNTPSALVVKTPNKMSVANIEHFIQENEQWIINRQQQIAQEIVSPLEHGSSIIVAGQNLTLIIIPRNIKHTEVSLLSDSIIIRHPHSFNLTPIILSALLKTMYIKTATHYLNDKTRHWQNIIGVLPNRVTIREQKTRWGSCSTNGSINYNWRILQAPEPIIDYLVVHELCHMKEPNHSHNFWQEVARYIPDWKIRRRWLKDNTNTLCRTFK